MTIVLNQSPVMQGVLFVLCEIVSKTQNEHKTR